MLRAEAVDQSEQILPTVILSEAAASLREAVVVRIFLIA